jgi:hypothetical protein
MYHIEGALKKLRATIDNKARVEGCIVEEFKVKGIVYFTKHHNINAPTMRYYVDEGMIFSFLSVSWWFIAHLFTCLH